MYRIFLTAFPFSISLGHHFYHFGHLSTSIGTVKVRGQARHIDTNRNIEHLNRNSLMAAASGRANPGGRSMKISSAQIRS